MAPSATLKFFRRSRMPRHPHARRQRRVDGVRRPVSLSIRHRAGGAAQRASTDPSSLRLPGRQKDCSRSPRHVFQRKCRYDAMSGCAVGTAAAPGNCTIVPCVCLRHERLRSCRALRASAKLFPLRLPRRHKDSSRSSGHVCQRKCHHDAHVGLHSGISRSSRWQLQHPAVLLAPARKSLPLPNDGPVATLCFGEAAETARRLRIARSSITGITQEAMYVSRPAGGLPFGDAAVAARCRRIARSSTAASSAQFATCIACCSCCASSDPALPNGVTWATGSAERVHARGQEIYVNAFAFVIRHFLF
ncbi:uncharacterized protein [Dermacentor albipictus]|uniref:uncharacterized protein isoform X1 n=1 Tax=Dermacentor albipictus TaxID=60249 RepID=UPI0038FC8A1A